MCCISGCKSELLFGMILYLIVGGYILEFISIQRPCYEDHEVLRIVFSFVFDVACDGAGWSCDG